ncbi:MAG: hypothetical protein K6G89_04495 [Clostridia bacterium]|nr:hypothetical protein [Clostridia bacterium]
MKICVFCGSFIEDNESCCSACGRIQPAVGEADDFMPENDDFDDAGSFSGEDEDAGLPAEQGDNAGIEEPPTEDGVGQDDFEEEGSGLSSTADESDNGPEAADGTKPKNRKKTVLIATTAAAAVILIAAVCILIQIFFGSCIDKNKGFYAYLNNGELCVASKSGVAKVSGIKEFSYSISSNGKYALFRIVELDFDKALYYYNGYVLRRIYGGYDTAIISHDGKRVLITDENNEEYDYENSILISIMGLKPALRARNVDYKLASPDLSTVVYFKEGDNSTCYVNYGREYETELNVVAVTDGGKKIYYLDGKKLCVTGLSNLNENKVILEGFESTFGSISFNRNSTQMLISSGLSTYFSSNDEPAVNAGSYCRPKGDSAFFSAGSAVYYNVEDFTKAFYSSWNLSIESIFSGLIGYRVMSVGDDGKFYDVVGETVSDIYFSDDCSVTVYRKGSSIYKVSFSSDGPKTELIADDASAIRHVSPDCGIIYYKNEAGGLAVVKGKGRPATVSEEEGEKGDYLYSRDYCVFIKDSVLYVSRGGSPSKAGMDIPKAVLSGSSSVKVNDCGVFYFERRNSQSYSFDGINWNRTNAGGR